MRASTAISSLPATRDGFLLAALAKKGDSITLPGKSPARITKVEDGVDFNFRRRVLIYTEQDPIVPLDYSPRVYIPVTSAA